MGLDMYLNGRKFLWRNYQNPAVNPMEDGFELKERILELGYWRKHPNLHGFIVNEFADGIDECQEIHLSREDLVKTLGAVEADELPHTEGFFFGESLPEDREPTIEILTKAIAWLDAGPKEYGGEPTRSVIYRASW
jgi:hypothetical protein